jgi:hypothetical protein
MAVWPPRSGQALDNRPRGDDLQLPAGPVVDDLDSLGKVGPRKMNADALVAWGAALGTFVASVMANDQSERLRNGAFGTVAGASLGGIAALFVNSKILVLFGVFGSAIGASAAWLVYLILAFIARKPAGRRILEYQIRGLSGVHDQLIADENTRLRKALDSWGANFARTITHEKDVLVHEGKPGSLNVSVTLAIYNWLSTIVNTLHEECLHELAIHQPLRGRRPDDVSAPGTYRDALLPRTPLLLHGAAH